MTKCSSCLADSGRNGHTNKGFALHHELILLFWSQQLHIAQFGTPFNQFLNAGFIILV